MLSVLHVDVMTAPILSYPIMERNGSEKRNVRAATTPGVRPASIDSMGYSKRDREREIRTPRWAGSAVSTTS
jgi:hypothetical protein